MPILHAACEEEQKVEEEEEKEKEQEDASSKKSKEAKKQSCTWTKSSLSRTVAAKHRGKWKESPGVRSEFSPRC